MDFLLAIVKYNIQTFVTFCKYSIECSLNILILFLILIH